MKKELYQAMVNRLREITNENTQECVFKDLGSVSYTHLDALYFSEANSIAAAALALNSILSIKASF